MYIHINKKIFKIMAEVQYTMYLHLQLVIHKNNETKTTII